MSVDLPDAEATESLGARLAGLMASAPGAWLITLGGSLGAGKTTLARGFLKALGHEGRVPSPTYTLLEPYEIGGRRVLHADLYRLAHPEELEYLGFHDAFTDDVVALIEWPERAGQTLRDPDLTVSLEIMSAGRKATITAGSRRGRELLGSLAG
jgi:tRNA threonylcarbamoyladenosine biosynthesis protein TsaE